MNTTVTLERPAALIPSERSGGRRWIVFVHQDGVLLTSIIRALDELGILEPSLAGESSVADAYPEVTERGFGYMRVGLRCLANQGWLAEGPTLRPETTVLRWTDTGRMAAGYWDHYVAVGRFLAKFQSNHPDAWSRPWTRSQIQAFARLLPRACDRWRLSEDLPDRLRALVTTHLDAGLAVPVMLRLRSVDALGGDGPSLPDGEMGERIGRLLAVLGWIDPDDLSWTAQGKEAARLAVHFGMAASYLPLLSRLPELYRGRLLVAPESGSGEWHVNRALNVSASAAAHSRYFDDADAIFTELFDREPVEEQPRFIADMGCGDGSWLVHLHTLITERTLRGRRLATDPLLMVGLDYNPAALDQAREVLDAAGIPALLLLGDISDPHAVSATLAKHGLAMEDGLHVRAFIDHDRSYIGAASDASVLGSSSGAYVDGDGMALSAEAVERDLVEHLRRWTPHVRKHGLVMLEAHCVAPWIARRHLGATHSVAFDAYHGHSHQYPIEHSAFLRCCREAGLRPASHCERRYPARRPFVAVSLNRLLAPEAETALPGQGESTVREDTWRPEPGTDLEDGQGLHELLYVGGDLRFPRLWCSAATGFVVAGALEAVEARLAAAQDGDVIRVLDYGAGTGLATIEFLKACRERGIEKRLEALGATLEMHLVDLPSSWFAQGFELLRGCAWTRFHSARAESGGFRPLPEVTGGRTMDAVMANMVFHLIPPKALERVAADLAAITAPGGRLLWNSPDLGPPGPYAVLFHDANRALRERWLEWLVLEEPPRARAANNGNGDAGRALRLAEAVRRVRADLDAAAMRDAQERANRRVLPRANSAEDVAAILAGQFGGDATMDLRTHELLEADVLDTLLVPSNQSEYLAELPDRALREQIIAELMLGEVLPAMQNGPAGTAEGLNVQWTLGAVSRDGPARA